MKFPLQRAKYDIFHLLRQLSTGLVLRVASALAGAKFEKGGAKDHFAVYLVFEAPFCLGRGWLCLLLKDTLGTCNSSSNQV